MLGQTFKSAPRNTPILRDVKIILVHSMKPKIKKKIMKVLDTIKQLLLTIKSNLQFSRFNIKNMYVYHFNFLCMRCLACTIYGKIMIHF
jgi:hypothetical protein